MRPALAAASADAADGDAAEWRGGATPGMERRGVALMPAVTSVPELGKSLRDMLRDASP